MFRDHALRCTSCQVDLEQYGERDKWRCPGCSAVVVASTELDVELGDLGAGLSDLLDTTRLIATPRACPTCATAMNQLSIDGIVIERCPADHTLWFEAGELGTLRDTLHERSAESVLVRLWDRWFH